MISTIPFWQHISGIAVINLDYRQDRWQVMAAQTAQLPGRPECTRIAACLGSTLPGFGRRPWFRGRKTDLRWAARAGCVASHRRVMRHAREAGWDTTLVIEDDCDLTPLMTSNLDLLHRVLFIEHPEWDVCYLGHNEIYPPALHMASLGGSGALLRVRGCATTHAYLVRAQARDWIIEHTADEENPWLWLSRHRAVDRWYARVLSRRFTVFALSPALLLQQTGYSDIGRHVVDWKQVEMITVVPVKTGFQMKLRMMHAYDRFLDMGDMLRGWWKRQWGY